MLKIRNRMGIPESKNSGMDTLEECHDKDHYLSYTKDISYRYNSKGFRDHEWPEDLSDVVWHHDRNHFGVDKDMANFSKNFKIVNELPTKIINLLIPFAFDDVKSVKEKYKNTIFTRNIDYARDHHHFDFKTSRGVSQLIIKKIIEFDNTSKYVL